MADIQGRQLMGWLPKDPRLGALDIDEIFVEWNGPRVFSCRSVTDQLYLAGWAEEREHTDLWLYLAVSTRRLQMARSGAIELADVFKNPEGALYAVVLDRNETVPDRVELIDPGSLEEKWLPAPNYRLELPTPTLPPAISSRELQRQAVQEGRTRFRIEISDRHRLRTEGSTRRVAELLHATQNVLDNLGLVDLEVDPKQDGRFANTLLQRMNTEVLQLAAASFVIDLGSADGEDLFGDSPIARVVNRLVNLLSAKSSPQDLWDALSDLKPRAAKSFRSFVSELASLESDVVVVGASKAHDLRQESLSSGQLHDLLSLLNQLVPDQVTLIRGRMVLFAGNTQNRRFGLRDLWTGTEYDGRVGERAIGGVSHATLLNSYDVVISAYAVQDRAIGQTAVRYVLEQLIPAESDEAIEPTVEVVSNISTGPTI